MAKFHPFLTELSAHSTSIFYFQDNNLSNSQWIFTKFDNVHWYCGALLWECSLAYFVNFWQLSARDMIMAGYYSLHFILDNGHIQFYRLKSPLQKLGGERFKVNTVQYNLLQVDYPKKLMRRYFMQPLYHLVMSLTLIYLWIMRQVNSFVAFTSYCDVIIIAFISYCGVITVALHRDVFTINA